VVPLVPQRDSDDFQLGPTDSSRAVDVVPMYWMQRGRAERRFCCSSSAKASSNSSGCPDPSESRSGVSVGDRHADRLLRPLRWSSEQGAAGRAGWPERRVDIARGTSIAKSSEACGAADLESATAA
jgi:hypothetical protein